ncbi:hypothetical protein G6N05_04240 [Flavobacterium sp. F372]|uniref:Porin n=1 Tax=Flavobacterium bernardetii TaxID=2813823 RepID=A0ABR7IWD6_9FLAO|nr:hypothetical protein [Flavobacterium bernardetii]MBC5834086.1 hypothetical protein [Flavobacterium bernardetii]NHF69318.1 hypothetical protein [Flavobacterium bernardetii]
MKKILTLCCFAASYYGFSQTTPAPVVAPVVTTATTEKEWDVSWYGFIRTDYIWDTRKSAQVREYNLNLYPLDEVLDVNGADLNDTGASNFLSVVSRLGAKVKGPNVWGAKISGTLEGDFFGNTESTIGLLRLRHAHVNLDWSKTSLLMGQTWYPTFIPEVFPGVANFSTGILFNPFGWASQVRLKQNFTKEFSGAITAYKEREFTTQTATGGTQNSASINSSVPTIHGQLQFKNKNWIAGLGAEFKSLQPLTESGGKVSNEKANSTSFVGYAKYSNDKFSVKAYGITGTDMANLVMLGGFVGYTQAGQVEKYESSKTTAYWIDIASNNKKVAPGLFFGMTTNDGTSRNLAAGETVKYYMRGVAGTRVVEQVMRVSGRVDFKQNKFRVTPEIEYTGATWGDLNANGDGTANLNKKDVSNMRFMISCAYSF